MKTVEVTLEEAEEWLEYDKEEDDIRDAIQSCVDLLSMTGSIEDSASFLIKIVRK